MQYAKRGVARGHVLDQDTHAINVENLRERIVFLAHFLYTLYAVFSLPLAVADIEAVFNPSRIVCRMRFITSRRFPRADLIAVVRTR